MFRRIPRLSKKRALFVALPVGVVALAVLLVVLRRPEEPGIRFRNWDSGGFISINETRMIDLFHLDMSRFQFPVDFPLTINQTAVYLKASTNNGQFLVKTDSSLAQYCAPSPDLRLLCAGPLEANVRDLLEDQQDAAMSDLRKHLIYHRPFFILTPGNPLIYVIPKGTCQECNFTYRTSCEWSTLGRIYCTTGYGTAWGVALFDLRSRTYIPLPHDGYDMETKSSFVKGYIFPRNVGPPQLLEVYNLDNTVAYSSSVEDWIADEDTLTLIAYCGDKALCIHKLEFDDHGLETTQEEVLGELRTENPTNSGADTREDILDSLWSGGYTRSSIVETRDEYLVSSYGKVYILSKATLQVERVLENPEAKSPLYEPHKIALYKDGNLLVTGSNDSGRLEVRSGVTLFDLSKCRVRLDDSCLVHSWPTLQRFIEGSMYYMPRDVYYSAVERPDLIFTIDQDINRLTISGIEGRREYALALAGTPRLVTTSTDGRFLLVATAPDYMRPLQDAEFHLFDLRTMQPDPRELVMGKNLMLVRGNTY